jgi:hypothetical protein
MTRRLFWLVMGITIGALVVRKLSAAAQKLTPQNMAGSVVTGLSELSVSIREFAVEVGAAMREREAELRDAAFNEELVDAANNSSTGASEIED